MQLSNWVCRKSRRVLRVVLEISDPALFAVAAETIVRALIIEVGYALVVVLVCMMGQMKLCGFKYHSVTVVLILVFCLHKQFLLTHHSHTMTRIIEGAD